MGYRDRCVIVEIEAIDDKLAERKPKLEALQAEIEALKERREGLIGMLGGGVSRAKRPRTSATEIVAAEPPKSLRHPDEEVCCPACPACDAEDDSEPEPHPPHVPDCYRLCQRLVHGGGVDVASGNRRAVLIPAQRLVNGAAP
jgi:hypothetical protein